MTSPGVSILIATYNGAKRLPETLAHLARQTATQDQIAWEVIVVDNNSTDGTAQVANALWPSDAPAPLRVIHEPISGTGHARRRAFTAATYELLSFVDDDNWVAPNWVEMVATVMAEHPEAGVCGGPSEAVCEVAPPPWFKELQHNYAVGPQVEQSGDITWLRAYVWGAGMTVRQSAWEALLQNGFSGFCHGPQGARRFSGEDVELCYALVLSGWRIWYDQRLQLRHFIPANRLTTAYAHKLLRANSISSIFLQQYRHRIKRQFGPTVPQRQQRLRGRWAYEIWHYGRQWVRSYMRAYRLPASSPQGFAERVKADAHLHAWLALLSGRATFQAMQHTLDAAAWRVSSEGHRADIGTPERQPASAKPPQPRAPVK